MTGFDIRESGPGDTAAIEALYPEAFPEEELRPLVRALLRETGGVLSLIAATERDVVGHVAFTPCSAEDAPVALLAPLAVAPAWQRRGLGSALVRAGLERLGAAGFELVLVLGDPGYYGRLGFREEHAVAPPYPLPEAWRGTWQSLALGAKGPRPRGTLRVPPAWGDPALWRP